MGRRHFLLSATSLLAVSGLHAQSMPMRRVAIAVPHTSGVPNEGLVAFRKRMGELGWVEGRNIEYVFAYADGDPHRYEPVIAGLLAKKPDVLYAYFGPMALTAMKLTRDVPIVFSIMPDPAKSGLVASLARPGGNVTGASTRATELNAKRIELLREIKPDIQRVAVVVNPGDPEVASRNIDSYSVVTRRLGMQLLTVDVRTVQEIPAAFDRAAREGVQGLLGTADPTHLVTMRTQLAVNATRAGIPAMFVDERYVDSGGLASYGTDNVDQIGPRGATYADKILRGAKPADLPVEEPTHFLMALNLATARKLKLTIPQSVLLRADRMIE